jgi:hypothetical protein
VVEGSNQVELAFVSVDIVYCHTEHPLFVSAISGTSALVRQALLTWIKKIVVGFAKIIDSKKNVFVATRKHRTDILRVVRHHLPDQFVVIPPRL